MDEVERALQVHVDNGIPLCFSHAQHETVLGDTGVVHQYVDASEVLAYLLHHVLCLGEVGCVACIGAAGHSHSLYLLACSFQSGSHLIIEHQVGECDVGTLRSELQSDGLSDASCRARYQRGLSSQ